MSERKIRFAIIGLDHNHVFNHCKVLLDAGAEFAAYYSGKPNLVAEFAQTYPHIHAAASMEEILNDPTIDLIGGAAAPEDRAHISVQAMRHGKDVIADKPAVVALAELDEIEKAQRETGRIWAFYASENHDRRCTVRASQMIDAGAIGRVVQTTGFGPHRVRIANPRPAWFFDRKISGGVIGDIGAHQTEQFLHFTKSTKAEVIYSATGNFAHPDKPDFEDYGEVSMVGDNGLGWFRVDWYTPMSISVPGDLRLLILGTEGYIETRKYIDPAGRRGGEHLLVVNEDGARFEDVSNVKLTFGPRLLDDIRNRTETAIPQARSFLAIRLAMEAQEKARHLDYGYPALGIPPKGKLG